MDELHGEEGLTAESRVSGASLIYLGDTRVVEASERLEFTLKSAQKFGAGQGPLDDLQCHATPGLVLLSLVYRSHAALAQQANNPVAPDTHGQMAFGVYGGWDFADA